MIRRRIEGPSTCRTSVPAPAATPAAAASAAAATAPAASTSAAAAGGAAPGAPAPAAGPGGVELAHPVVHGRVGRPAEDRHAEHGHGQAGVARLKVAPQCTETLVPLRQVRED